MGIGAHQRQQILREFNCPEQVYIKRSRYALFSEGVPGVQNGGVVEESGPFDEQVVGETKPIRVAKPDSQALRVVASKSHRDQATDDYIAQYDVVDLVSAGSSLKFCLVAAVSHSIVGPSRG